MANKRTTFGKLQREREKQAKQQAKQERRAAAREANAAEDPPAPVPDQERLLAAFAALHEDLDAHRISLEDFELKRDQLREQLQAG